MQVYPCKASNHPSPQQAVSPSGDNEGQTDGDESKIYGHEESSEKNRCKDRSGESHEGIEREHQEGAGEEAGRQGIEGQEEEQLRATGEKPARHRVRALSWRRQGSALAVRF